MAPISQMEPKNLNSSYFFFQICAVREIRGQNQPPNSGQTVMLAKPMLQSESREIQQKQGLPGLNRAIPA